MTATVEYFDPARHGAIVRDFVTSAAACAFGFRQNQLSQEGWQHLLGRADGGKCVAVLLAEDGVRAVVVPTIRSSPVFGPNAFLHVFGQPDSRMIAAMADRLSLEKFACFCQTLVSAEATDASRYCSAPAANMMKTKYSCGAKTDRCHVTAKTDWRSSSGRLPLRMRPAWSNSTEVVSVRIYRMRRGVFRYPKAMMALCW